MVNKRNKHAHATDRPGVSPRSGVEPPREYRWKPGQTGNPKGPPKKTTHLWTHLCQFLAMSEAELKKLERRKLTQSQLIALRLVEQGIAGQKPLWDRLARYCVDRDEGRPVERLIVDDANTLTDVECDRLRDMLRGRADDRAE